MSTDFQKHLAEVPAYLSGRMSAEEHEAFEAFAHAHPELQREIDDLKSTVGFLADTFEAASHTDFRLSQSRRATIRRETDANIISFPQTAEPAVVKTHAMRWASGFAVLAASLLVGVYVGLDTDPRPTQPAAPEQVVATETPAQDSLPASGYEYHPGYGLETPDPWQVAGSVEFASKRNHDDFTPDLFSPIESWNPSSLGLDGPRAFYSYSTLRGPGAI